MQISLKLFRLEMIFSSIELFCATDPKKSTVVEKFFKSFTLPESASFEIVKRHNKTFNWKMAILNCL